MTFALFYKNQILKIKSFAFGKDLIFFEEFVNILLC
jgi:hypothetical protein